MINDPACICQMTLDRVKGHPRSQGSKRLFSLKSLLLLLIIWHDHVTCVYDRAWDPVQMLLDHFFYLRSFGVTRSNSKVKFPKIFKNKVLLHNRRYGHVTQVCEVCTHHICQLCSLSWSEVKWGHRGQKVIFTQNATSPSLYVLWSCNSSIWSVCSTCMPLVLL